MKLIKCDMCTELVGDLQLEVLRVGDRNYDLHKKCAKKLKETLKGAGEYASPAVVPVWVTPTFTEPYLPPVFPSFPYVNPTTPVFPYTTPNQPFITCHNSAGNKVSVSNTISLR